MAVPHWTICCRCGQPNEPQRSYCWVCYRDLTTSPSVDDYRKLLGVSAEDSDDLVKNAYRRLAVKYHPDKNPLQTDIAEAQFKLVNEAYQTLSGIKPLPEPLLSYTSPAAREPPSFEELQSILGGFAFRTRPTLIERLATRNTVIVLLIIGVGVTALELLRTIFSFFFTTSTN